MDHEPVLPRSVSQRTALEQTLRYGLSARGQDYLARRGLAGCSLPFADIPVSAVDSLAPYAGRLVIPSVAADGHVYDVTFRCMEDHDCKIERCRKYLRLPGIPARLYGVDVLAGDEATVDICEGQIDAATLRLCGFNSVGVPGVDHWKRHHHRLFLGYEQVRVWADGDEPGRKFAEKVSREVPNTCVIMIPNGQDVNSIYVNGGRNAVMKLIDGESDATLEAIPF